MVTFRSERPEGPSSDASRSGDDDPDSGTARRRRIASMRSIIVAATILGILDAGLLLGSGAGLVRAILGGVLMGGFIVFGMRTIVRLRLRYRPVHDDPSTRDPSAVPPRGGWATPTRGQSSLSRIGRNLRDIWRPRPPRERRERGDRRP